MDKEKFKNVVECLLFVTNRALPLAEIADIAGESQEDTQQIIDEIKADLESRPTSIQLAQVAEGYQFATKEGYGYWVKKLYRDQTLFKLSQSALETLSIIAYKQPITRAEIEEIRGVEVIGVLETLTERKLVKVAGRKESVGRPLLYATAQDFLRHFNLWKISDLPSLEDLAREAERKQAQEAAAPTQAPEPLAQTEPAAELPSETSTEAAVQTTVETATATLEAPQLIEDTGTSDEPSNGNGGKEHA